MRMLVHASCAMFFLVRSVRTEVVMLRPWPMYQSDMAAFGIPHKTSRNSRLLDARAYVASFELLDSERLIWTSPPDAKGKVVFAVMQVDTHETEKVINMQRFVNHVHSVTCGASQTHISFVQHEAFQAAVDAWSWVNLADAHLMHVISYWKDCLSPEGNFKPFHFTKMSTEALTRTIILEGTEQEWAKALHSWTLELGDGPDEPDKPFPPPPPGAVMEESAPSQEPNLNRQKASWRSTFGDISKYGWNVDHSRTLVANLNSDFGHTVAPKVALNDHGYQGFWVCHKCFTSGTVTFRYRFHMRFFILLESDVWMTMQNVGAGVEWEVGLYAENTISIEYLTKAWKFSLGVSGVNIPGVANIGMYVQAAWGIGATKFRGRFNVTGAMALHIPNGSKVHIDFMKGKIDRGDFKYIYYKNSPKLKGVAEGTLYANTILGGGSRFEIFGHTRELISVVDGPRRRTIG
ncbi:BQ2448_6865 [Microbotryum intermedium]|uniref:BQ2448_6865 protein n=1 Tax=Microbotryum intermedium TaxID=269621 RepID=A0A238FGK8_9BASI|nr:BQ2448_6865 [Microbotryum intermedium]